MYRIYNNAFYYIVQSVYTMYVYVTEQQFLHTRFLRNKTLLVNKTFHILDLLKYVVNIHVKIFYFVEYFSLKSIVIVVALQQLIF